MTRGRLQLLLVLWAMLVFGLSVRSLATGLLGDVDVPRAALRPVLVDLNRANVGELTALPGIGWVRAEAIVLDRIRNGPFRTLEDLDRVDGLGPETLVSLRPFVLPRPAAGAGSEAR